MSHIAPVVTGPNYAGAARKGLSAFRNRMREREAANDRESGRNRQERLDEQTTSGIEYDRNRQEGLDERAIATHEYNKSRQEKLDAQQASDREYDRARQQKLDTQNESDREYKAGLRPKNERLLNAGVGAAEADLKKKQSTIAKELEQEGFAKTLKLIDLGEYGKAVKAWNSTGTERDLAALSLDSDGDTIHYTTDKGKVGKISRNALINAATASGKPRNKYSGNSYGVVNQETGDFKPYAGSVGKGAGAKDANKVQLTNGQWATSAELRKIHAQKYGKPQMGGGYEFDDNAPPFVDWMNSVVKPGFAFPESNVSSPIDPAPTTEEIARARAELNTADGGDKAEDFIPFNEPSNNEVLMQAYRNRGIAPPQPALGVGGGTSNPESPEPAQVALPQQAAQSLREGVITTFANGQSWKLENGQPVRIK